MADLTISRDWLYRNDEDYTDSVCLLLPGGQATLIDSNMFDYLIQFKWGVDALSNGGNGVAFERLLLKARVIKGQRYLPRNGFQQARILLVIAQANRYSDTVALFQALGGGWWNRQDVAEQTPLTPRP